MKIRANRTIKIETERVNNSIEDKTTFFYYAFRNILLVSLPLLVISAFILSLPRSSATASSTDNVTFSLDVSCTISSNVLDPHTLILSGSGLYRENIGTTKVGVFCNDNNGYNIYTVGHSNNIDGNTDLVASNVSSDYNIETGVYSSGDTVSSWGMKLTAGTGTGAGGEAVTPPTIVNGYNNYNVVPNVYTLVASRPSGTNMNKDADIDVTGSYFTTTYDIYASSAQPADTYNGKVKYILTHPSTNAPNTINSIDAAFALAGKQKAYQDENGSYYAMQDMTSEICNSVINTGESTSAQLVDIRDHNIYWVTKEKDGHCWMTQNLDLDINGVNTSPLNSNNTDISSDPAISGAGIYGTNGGYAVDNGVYTWNPGTTTANVIVDFTDNTATGWNGSIYTPSSGEGGNAYIYTSDTNNNDVLFTSLEDCVNANHTESECSHYHVGNYYNWSATVASNNTDSFGTPYKNADNSICPKGWRLPIADSNDHSVYEFGKLLFDSGIIPGITSTSYADNGFRNIRRAPLWFTRSGGINNNTLQNLASRGRYWSATITTATNYAYGLYLHSSSLVYPNGHAENTGPRSLGWSVRCLAR